MTTIDIDRYAEQRRRIVQNISAQKSIDTAVNIILDSGWDYRDPHGIMKREPEYVEAFLRDLSTGQRRSLDSMHKKMRDLLCYIVDAWLRCH